jgi:TRAP-type C4-dicarboxylate transport system permease small subunit
MVVAMAVLVVGVNLQVCSRFFLDSSLSWTQELVKYAFVWMVFIGAGVGVRHRLHLRIDLLEARFGPRGRRILGITVDLLCLILAAVFIVGGLIVAWRTRQHLSPAMGLSMACVYSVFPLSGLGMAVFLLEAIVCGRRPEEIDQSEEII